ncbi:LCP family protein [Leifsonia shinshuensis]|uniref:LytR family transcriptional regulator n=1 Tax=Leifsonia shinshuensis TaxID=150026 RepID=A0A7G6Y9H9_9MICO|nr:LCP family protein [Leifsonia shinshuensis]QNE35144.1 LytR family transcriptional regulator [Leifsonia shinshuensis]
MRHSTVARPTPVRHGRLPVRRARGPVARLLASIVAVAVISTGAIAAYAVQDTVRSLKPAVHLVSAAGKPVAVPAVGAESGAVNILLAGTDTRTGQGGQFSSAQELAGSSGAGNNDVTMVLHLSADHQHATVISIPRDLMVPIPSCPTSGGGSTSPQDSAQFNTTLSTGGLSCVVLTAEALTGLSIPYAAEISFDGVSAMSNAVGGVTVCLATPLTDPYVGLNLPAGQQTLVGAQALAFVRSRHGVGDGSDLGRISNQQLFLSALLRKVTSAGVLGNPLTLFTLAKAATSNLTLSDTMASPTTLVSIGLALKSVSLSDFVFLQYPSMTDPDNNNRVVPEPTGVDALKQALSTDTPVQLTGTTGNGTEAATPTPSATATPSSTPTAAATPAPSATSSAASGSTPAPTSSAVSLPSNVTGQTAAQQTCTKGN